MNKPTERSLTLEEQVELAQELADARKLLDASVARDDGAAVVEAVRALIDQARDEPETIDGSVDDLGFLAGLLFGDALARLPGWSWTYLTYDNGFESACVASADRAYVSFPFHYVHALMTEAGADNTVLLTYNLITEGKLPEATAGALLPLM